MRRRGRIHPRFGAATPEPGPTLIEVVLIQPAWVTDDHLRVEAVGFRNQIQHCGAVHLESAARNDSPFCLAGEADLDFDAAFGEIAGSDCALVKTTCPSRTKPHGGTTGLIHIVLEPFAV